MVTEIITSTAAGQGFGYLLFVFMLFYVLKKQETRDKKTEEREEKYQGIIDKLMEKFNIVEIVKKDVEEIKEEIRRR